MGQSGMLNLELPQRSGKNGRTNHQLPSVPSFHSLQSNQCGYVSGPERAMKKREPPKMTNLVGRLQYSPPHLTQKDPLGPGEKRVAFS